MKRNPIPVAYLLGTLSLGGAERHLAHLLERIDRDRFRPHLFLTRKTGDFLPGVEAAGVPVEETGIRSVVSPCGLRGIHSLAGRMGRLGIRLVHSYLYGSNLIGAGLAALDPGLIHLVGIRQQQLPRAAVFRALFNLSAGPRTQFVSVSRAADHVLGTWGIGAQWRHRVPNGVEIPDLMPPEERLACRQELGLPELATVITMVANLSPIKGHRTLIEAVARLVENQSVSGTRTGHPPDLRLVLVGNGPLMAECRDLAERRGLLSRTLFLGHRSDVAQILQSSDLFVLNSKSEGMSNALLEALAVGLPCVVTAVGGNLELVTPGRNGYQVPVEDAGALARRLAELIDDRSLREEMGARSRTLAQTEYSLDAMISRTEAIYDAVLAGGDARDL